MEHIPKPQPETKSVERDRKGDAVRVLKGLRESLYEWDDTIPDKIIMSGEQKVKIRTNWFQGAISELGFATRVVIQDDPFAAEVRGIVEPIADHIRSHRGLGLNRAEDIQAMNGLLRRAIEKIEVIYPELRQERTK